MPYVFAFTFELVNAQTGEWVPLLLDIPAHPAPIAGRLKKAQAG